MPRYLFTTLTSNDLGLLARTLPIARELAQHGQEVAFCNPSPAPAKLIAEAGFPNLTPAHPLFHVAVTDRLTPLGLWRQLSTPAVQAAFGGPWPALRCLLRDAPRRLEAPGEIWNYDQFVALLGFGSPNFLRANVEAFRLLMLDYQPDVVVDSWNPFAVIAARALGKPVATVTQADGHPASRGFIWWKEPTGPRPCAADAVNPLLAEYGLPPVRSAAEFNVGDLTLVVGIPEIDPLPEGVPVTYIGPLVWQKPGAALPEWIERRDPARPLVWVYSGNPQYFPVRTPVDSRVVLQACVEALADEPLDVALTTGHHALPAQFQRLPANFHYTPYAPGLSLAARCQLLIHHGGYGSCQTGLLAGTPAVIIPTYAERESNARRLVAAGAAAMLRPTEGRFWQKHLSAKALRLIVRGVISDPSYAANARRLQTALLAYGGAVQAAKLIAAL
jgi:UDP:flavonoid glycosyltransferase YjiC (YdhE family)